MARQTVRSLILCSLGLLGAVVPTEGGPPKEKVFPLKKLAWQRPTFLDKFETTGEVEPGQEAKPWIDRAVAEREGAAVVPGFRPFAVGDVMVYRTYNGVSALYVKDDKAGKEYKAGQIHFRTTLAEGGMASLVTNAGARWSMEDWVKNFPKAELFRMLLEGGVASVLSHDGQQVYMVDDLWVLPPPGYDPKKLGKAPDELKVLLGGNRLWAFDLKTGKITWMHGGGFWSQPGPLAKTHFLGAPLPHKGKLYVLNETPNGDLRLLVLDADTGKVEATINVDTVPETQRFQGSVRRRLNPAQLVEHEGLLVCLTHTGKVYGVDVAKQAVRWTYLYQKDPPAEGGKFPLGSWKAPTPFIHDGKVVFTAADDDQIHCVNLADGTSLWKMPRGDDLYVAGIIAGKVLVVGNAACRALALKDGKEAWQVATGTPSGLGVFDKTTYLLPLKKGAVSQQPEIAYLDAEQGKKVGTSPLTEAPGNLILHHDMILSQSATTVTGYTKGS
jgi:outer membrane protein assembly factor BamB